METIEKIEQWQERYGKWQGSGQASRDDVGEDYPWIENTRSPFVPARRALPMMNLALISSAGAYIDGTEAFDVNAAGGDMSFREIPVEVEAENFRFAARGYDPQAVQQDLNAQVPLERLMEFQNNGIIGQFNSVFWSFCGFIPDAGRMIETLLPELVTRLKRYEVQAALLIPASKLCHQSIALVARGLEQEGIPTMMLAVARDIVEGVHPPRAGYYKGEFGSVAGRPNWPEFQRRILDESLRLLEPMDQPSVYKLTVDLETFVQKGRGER